MRWILFALAGLVAAPSAAGEVPMRSPTFFALSVSNLDASVDWYTKMLALTANPVHESEDVRITLMTGTHVVVELIEHRQAQGAPSNNEEAAKRYLRHGLFKVGYFVDDLDVEVERLRQRGANFRGSVVNDQLLRARTILMQDNEGNIVQLFQRLDEG